MSFVLCLFVILVKKFATGEKSKSRILILYELLSFHGCQNMMKLQEYVIF